MNGRWIISVYVLATYFWLETNWHVGELKKHSHSNLIFHSLDIQTCENSFSISCEGNIAVQMQHYMCPRKETENHQRNSLHLQQLLRTVKFAERKWCYAGSVFDAPMGSSCVERCSANDTALTVQHEKADCLQFSVTKVTSDMTSLK